MIKASLKKTIAIAILSCLLTKNGRAGVNILKGFEKRETPKFLEHFSRKTLSSSEGENNTYFKLVSLFALKKHIEDDLESSQVDYKEVTVKENKFFSSIENDHLLVLTLKPQETLNLIKKHIQTLKEEEKTQAFLLMSTLGDTKKNFEEEEKIRNLMSLINVNHKAQINSKIKSLQSGNTFIQLKECSERIGCEVHDLKELNFTQILLEYLLLSNPKSYDFKLFQEKNTLNIDKGIFLEFYKRSYFINLAEVYMDKLFKAAQLTPEPKAEETIEELTLNTYKSLVDKFKEHNFVIGYETSYIKDQKEKEGYLKNLNSEIATTIEKYHKEGFEIVIKKIRDAYTASSHYERYLEVLKRCSKNETTLRIKEAEEIGTKRALKETFIIKE